MSEPPAEFVVPEPPVELVFQDNGSFVYGSARSCAGCSRVLDDRDIDGGFVLRNRTFDISVSADGAVVVSNAFVAACSELDGVRFDPLPSEPNHALFVVERVVRIEPYASGVASGPICDECGEPRYRVRRGPLHIEHGQVLQPGFSRTDLTFGDTGDFGREQPVLLRPHFVLDRLTGRVLKGAGLIGIHLIVQP